MGNRIDIFVNIDPTGAVPAGVRNITNTINILNNQISSTGKSSAGFLDIFKGNLLAGYFKEAASAVIDFGKESVTAYAQVVKDERFLNAQIKETGVNFAQAYDEVDRFDKQLALSKDNAEKLYATTLQFTNELGKTKDTGKFITSLSDIIVSHGGSPEDQADITRSLLAGRATELAKILGKNITTLEKELSTQAGVDFTKLDDAEKKAILFNAVLKEGEKNAGASSLRLGELDGKLATISASYDRAKESAGKFITTQTALKGVVDLLNYLAGGKSEADYQKEKDEQVKREIEARANSRDAFLRIQDELNKDPSKRFQNQDYLTAYYTHVDPQKIREAIEKAHATFKGMAGNIAGVDLDPYATTEAIKGVEEDARKAGAAQAKALHDTFVDQYKNLFKPGGGSENIVILDYAKRQFDQIKGVFDPAEMEEIGTKLNEALRKQYQKGLDYLKNLRGEAEKQFTFFTSAYNTGGNPYVKVFAEADEAARKLQKTFGALGEDQVKSLQALVDKQKEASLAILRVDDQLHAAELRRTAERYANPGGGLSRGDEAQLKILNDRLDAAKAIPEYLAKADALEAGRATKDKGLDPDRARILNEQYKNLLGLLDQAAYKAGELGRAERSAVDKQLTGFFENLTPEEQFKVARGRAGAGTRDVFAGAYRRQAEEQKRQIEDDIRQAAELDRERKGIKEDINIINQNRAKGLDPAQADKRLLASLGRLDPKDLTADLRKEGYDAARREADRVSKQEAEGKDIAAKARESTDKLTGAIDKLAGEMKNPENRKILIEILNRAKADAHEDLYGADAVPPPANPSTR